MINFNLSEEQLLIKKTAKEFAKNELLSGAIERDDKKIWPEAQIKKMGDLKMSLHLQKNDNNNNNDNADNNNGAGLLTFFRIINVWPDSQRFSRNSDYHRFPLMYFFRILRPHSGVI